MDTRVKIAVVNYLNSRPFIVGLETIADKAKIITDSPARVAEMLQASKADIALVPVAVIPHLKDPQIVSKYCIGADGPVKTVCIFAERPMNKWESVYLDYQSRTSVELAKILCREFWKIDPHFVPAYPGFEGDISGTSAGVVIGDRAIHLLERYPYVYDMAEAWKEYTGLPFVFACWVATKAIDEGFLKEMENAFKYGLSQREKIAAEEAQLNSSVFTADKYLTEHIHYELTPRMRKGMQLFLKKVSEAQMIAD